MAHPNDLVHPVHPLTRIGHVHLKVADLDRALNFYHGILGFQVMQRMGNSAAFLSAGGYHHHIGLNTWESLGASPPPARTTGLYHIAILYPTRPALADALRRLNAAKIPLEGAADHGVSEAIYLRDPDSNGVELFFDRPENLWPRMPSGEFAVKATIANDQGCHNLVPLSQAARDAKKFLCVTHRQGTAKSIQARMRLSGSKALDLVRELVWAKDTH